jgi:hypothetical protein
MRMPIILVSLAAAVPVSVGPPAAKLSPFYAGSQYLTCTYCRRIRLC